MIGAIHHQMVFMRDINCKNQERYQHTNEPCATLGHRRFAKRPMIKKFILRRSADHD